MKAILTICAICCSLSLATIAALEIGRWSAHRRYQKAEQMSEAWLHRQARITKTNGSR